MSYFWKDLKEETPSIANIGMEIFFRDKNGNNYVGKCYESFDTWDFEDQDGLEIEGVTHWAEIPNLI